MRFKLIKTIKSVPVEDSLKKEASMEKEQFIGIDFEKILSQPRSKYDLLLQNGDRLEIPKKLEILRLSGALLCPFTIRYEERKLLRHYNRMPSSLSTNDLPHKAFELYARGSIKTNWGFMGVFVFIPVFNPGPSRAFFK